ncbi:MAG TPA: hypothetical protein VF817_00705 [Patescibacteria group bacterium]
MACGCDKLEYDPEYERVKRDIVDEPNEYGEKITNKPQANVKVGVPGFQHWKR